MLGGEACGLHGVECHDFRLVKVQVQLSEHLVVPHTALPTVMRLAIILGGVDLIRATSMITDICLNN